MCVKCDLGHPEACDNAAPECVDCGNDADVFTATEWICDACDDARLALAAQQTGDPR